jgi:outer membrane protein assembly factor BamB
MRKLVFLKQLFTALIFLLLVQAVKTQEFGRSPLRECWRVENDNLDSHRIASDNVNRIFFSYSGGIIEAVDKTLGKSIWRSEFGGEIISPIMTDQKKVYLVFKNTPPETNGDSEKKITIYSIRSLSIETGLTTWQKLLPLNEDEKVFFIEAADKLYVLTQGGLIQVLNKQNGEIFQEKKNALEISTIPSLVGDNIYVGTTDKKIVVLSKNGTKIQDEVGVKDIPTAILTPDAHELYVGDKSGNIVAINMTDKGIRWKTWTGAEIVSLSKVPNGILVSSFDNFVYLLSAKNGKRIWKKRLSGRSIGQPLIKNDIAVFSTLGGTDTVFIELKKGQSINRISIQNENYFVNNPSGIDDLVILPTNRGLFAYGSEKNCAIQK